MISHSSKYTQRWLQFLILLIHIMILVGGVTRLTRSGLSIVEWKPITGILPPLSDKAWHDEFSKYQNSPEYQQVNKHFELNDYQKIFFWEYLHRLLGRLIFLFAIVPGVYFWYKKQIKGSFTIILPALIGLQGLIGWIMVRSGLYHRPSVSHYLLALHFFTALSLAFYVLANYSKIGQAKLYFLPKKFKYHWWLFSGLLTIQIFWGCLVSGLKAGFASNTFPLMAKTFFPSTCLLFEPLWINFLENPTAVHWAHRWIGISLFSYFLIYYFVIIKIDIAKEFLRQFRFVLVILILQILLGIATIVYSVPIPLAAAHQLVAAILACFCFRICWQIR